MSYCSSLNLGNNAMLGVTWPAVPPPVKIIRFMDLPPVFERLCLQFKHCKWKGQDEWGKK